MIFHLYMCRLLAILILVPQVLLQFCCVQIFELWFKTNRKFITLMLAVPILQIKCTVLAIVLLAIGTEPRTHCNYSDHVTEFRYSFLVIPSPTSLQSLLGMSTRGFRNYEALPRSDQYEHPPRQSFFSHIKTFFRRQFHRRVTLC